VSGECECECNVCNCVGSVDLTSAMAGSSVSAANPEEVTLDNVRNGKVKTNLLKKFQLQELCATLFGYINRLELDLEKNRAPTTCPPPTRPLSSGQR
jgi:hypothetical protein